MRRVVKIALITVAATVLLVVAAAAALLLTMDDYDYRRLAAYLVERSTGRTLVVDGRFAVYPSLRPSLVMSQVRIPNPPWASGPDLAQIGHLEVQIALRPLLSGTLVVDRLIVNDATFALERSADGQESWAIRSDDGGDGVFGRFVPIFGTVRMRNVDWRYRDDASGRETSGQLAHLTLEEDGASALLDAQGAWDGQALSAKGRFGTLAEALAPTGPFPVDLTAVLPGLDLKVSGTIVEPTRGRGLDLRLAGDADDIAQFMHLLDPDAPLAGRLNGNATLGGDLDALQVTELDLSVGEGSDDQKPELRVTGKIATVRPGGAPVLEGIDLEIQGAIPTAVLSRWLGRPLPDLGEARGQVTLGGTSEVLSVSAMRLQAGEGSPLAIDATGSIAQLRLAPGWSVQGADLQLEAKADDPAALESLLGVSVPQLGALSYAGRLSGASGSWQLAGTARVGATALEQTFTGNLEGTPPRLSGELAVTLAGLQLNARGTIADARSGQGVDLHVTGRSDDVAKFLGLLGQRAPQGGRLTGEATLGGTFEALKVTDLQISLDPGAGPAGHRAVEAKGTVQTVRLGGAPLLDGIAVQVRGATAAAVLSRWLGRPLPDFGAVRGHFTLTGSSETLKVTAMSLDTGPQDGLTISANGAIAGIRPTRGFLLQGSDLRLEIAAPHPPVIGALLGTRLPPLAAVAYAGRLSGGTSRWSLAGKVQVGRTVIDEALTAAFGRARPRISGELSTPALHLADFGVASDATSSNGDLTLASLGALDRFDLDLTVTIDQIEGTRFAIGGGEVNVALEDRLLRIDPARFEFVHGTALLHATADARSMPPQLDVSLHADDVQLGEFLLSMGRSAPIAGELALIVKARGEGESAAQLKPSLDGEVHFAIQRGDIDLSVNLATADLVTWLLVGAERGAGLLRGATANSRTTLECLAGRFVIERGVATVQSLLMQTPLTLSTATGTLDLVNQTIDLVVHLRARRGSAFDPATTYRIHGPMDDPALDFSRTGFAARTIAGLVMTPIDALGSLLRPLVADGGGDPTNPCLQ